MQRNDVGGQVSLFGPDMEYGRTCPEPSPADGTPSREENSRERTSKSSSSPSSKLKNHTFMLLDLRPGAGNMLGPCWEYDPVWLGSLGTLNTSECPSAVVESSLSQILQDTVPSKYYLSPTACMGILRRAEERGKDLPTALAAALRLQAGFHLHSGGVYDLLHDLAAGRAARVAEEERHPVPSPGGHVVVDHHVCALEALAELLGGGRVHDDAHLEPLSRTLADGRLHLGGDHARHAVHPVRGEYGAVGEAAGYRVGGADGVHVRVPVDEDGFRPVGGQGLDDFLDDAQLASSQ